jgi:hypothetical protein
MPIAGPLALRGLRASHALTQAFLDRVLHQHRNVLRHPRTLVTVGFPMDGVVHLTRFDPVAKLPGELVSHPVELLIEDLTAKFWGHRHSVALLHLPPILGEVAVIKTR